MSELVVEFCVDRGPGGESEGGGPWAGGVVVSDAHSGRAIYASGHVLSEATEAGEATYHVLVLALSLIERVSATEVELRCSSQELVDQLTGGAPVEGGPVVEGLFDQAMMRLLQLGLWRIRRVEAEQMRRARELAEAALSHGSEVVEIDQFEAYQREQAAGQARSRAAEAVEPPRPQPMAESVSLEPDWPRWTVTFAENAGPRCPVHCHLGQRFGFGPDTPAGFCVYAMAAVAEDGPLTWSDPTQQRMTTTCPHCDVPMDIEKLP